MLNFIGHAPARSTYHQVHQFQRLKTRSMTHVDTPPATQGRA